MKTFNSFLLISSELYMSYYYFEKVLVRRYPVKLLFGAYFLVFLLGFCLNVNVQGVLQVTLNYLLLILVVTFSYRGSLTQKAFNFIIFISYFLICEQVTNQILKLIWQIPSLYFLSVDIMLFLKIMINSCAVALLLWLPRLIFASYIEMSENKNEMITFLCFPVTSLVIIYLWRFPSDWVRMPDSVLLVLFVLLLLANFLNTCLLARNREKTKLRLENFFLQEKYEQNKRHYELILQKDQELKRIQHDIHKHLNILAVYCNDNDVEKARDYLHELSEFQMNSRIIVTGNKDLDLVLSTFSQRIQEEKIDIDTEQVENLSHLKIAKSELFIIYGNILENAIESCQSCERKWIKICIKEVNQQFGVIKIINSCSSVKKNEKGHYVTTKDGAIGNHGLGLLSVRQIIKKVGGEVKFEFDEAKKEFVSEVILSLEREEDIKRSLNDHVS